MQRVPNNTNKHYIQAWEETYNVNIDTYSRISLLYLLGS